MKQIKAIIITILTLFLTNTELFPVTSRALDNNADQLIWQTAWYSKHLNDDEGNSPFSEKTRKLTDLKSRSIFITPTHDQNSVKCPSGYKHDQGKCIKVVNINQGSILRKIQ